MAGRSLRIRLTLLFALVTSVSIVLLGVFLDFALSSQLSAREREELAGKAELFKHVLSETHSRADLEAARHRFADILVGHAGLRADVLDATGVPVVRLSAYRWPSTLSADAARDGVAEKLVMEEGEPFRLLAVSSPLPGSTEPLVVAMAMSGADAKQILARFRTTIVLACLLSSLAAGALGYAAAVRGLRPLRNMVRAAAGIGADQLDQRLEIREVPPELRELAESFNGMLARLEQSFRRLSDFSSDLAHELRTPLTNLILHSQVALSRPREEGELRGVLTSGLEELERLARMVNDMLFIAKADHAQIRLAQEHLALESEVGKVFEYFQPLAEERNVRLACDGSATAWADRSMVRRVIANLVSNAVRHAQPSSTVTVKLSSGDGAAAINVHNEGSPLSEREAERVFDRFYRGESSRTVSSEGAGLGLAIVKSIVDLHGGTASARATPTGTTFRVTLPGESQVRAV